MPATLKRLAAGSACVLFATSAWSQGADDRRRPAASATTEIASASPIFGVTVPDGYRRWTLIAPSHVPGFNELRGIHGNATAVKAYEEGALPFPDGTVLVKLAWTYTPSPDFDGAFAPGPATSVQVMVKDAKKYASTGGWGFGKFIDGRPVDEAEHAACFACHEAHVKDRDYVFTRFAP